MVAVGVAPPLLFSFPVPAPSMTCWPPPGGASAQRGHADRHLGDLALHGAAQDLADVGFLLALPVVFWRSGDSSRRGLYTHEKRLGAALVVSSTLLFFVGVGFAISSFWAGVQLHPELCAQRTSQPRLISRPTSSFVICSFVWPGLRVPHRGDRSPAPWAWWRG